MNYAKSMFLTVAFAAVLLFSLSAQAEPPFTTPPLNPINQEVADRIAGDQNLQDQIDQEVIDRFPNFRLGTPFIFKIIDSKPCLESSIFRLAPFILGGGFQIT